MSVLSRLADAWHIHVEYPLEHFGPFFSKRWHHRAGRWLGRALYMARRWIEGARNVQICTDLDDTDGHVYQPGLAITFDGACPVQGDGIIDGRACYYRSRGEGWQFHVAAPGKGQDDVFDDDAWVYSERRYFFPDGGWVAASVSRDCILKAAAIFRFDQAARRSLSSNQGAST